MALKGITPPRPISYRNLDSSRGLYNVAVKNGLQREADMALAANSGEKTKEYFSGGFISDIFDVLNTFQYGVVGLAKGRSFAEGVKTRQSFTDKDALGDSGIPGIIMGTILDIALDPLTYIAPVTVVKKFPVLSKLGKAGKEAIFGKMVTKTIEEGGDVGKILSKVGEAVEDVAPKIGKVLPEVGQITSKVSQAIPKTYQEFEGGTRVGRYLANKFVYMFGADPVFKNVIERGVANIATSTDIVAGLAKIVGKIEPSTAAKLIERGADNRWTRVPLEKVQTILKPEEFEAVKTLNTKLEDLGKQAVDLKLLSKEQYERGMGEYLKATYTKYELDKSKGLFGFSKAGIPPIKKRKDLTPEQMKELGQINDPAYLLFKSIFDLTKSVENANMMRVLATRFGSRKAMNGFEQIKDTKKWGDLAGMYVPRYMKDYLTEIIEPAADTIGRKLIAGFKYSKVILNPATHARNIISNKILNWWKLGMNPLDPRVMKSDATALSEILKGSGKWINEAKPLGYNVDTFAANELKSLLNSPESMNAIQKAGGKGKSIIKSLGDMYQKEESWAKLSAYIFNRTTKNMNPSDAWKAAESATFNYAQVSPFVRRLRESMFGFPFITFTIKATPVALETAYKAPQRIGVIGKIKNSIEKLSDIEETDRERASEPSWVKDGFYIKLPMKDSKGRSAYFDLTYILPFGDLISGNFFERPLSTKTGLPESYITSLAKKSPFINLVSEIGKNKDFYGNSIWKESDTSEKQLGDLMRHITKSYAPPMVSDQLPGGYNEKGVRQQRGLIGAMARPEDKESQQRTVMQELFRNVGMKVQPIDADIQETYQEWNRKKALQLLLLENGVLSNFNRVYVPKKK